MRTLVALVLALVLAAPAGAVVGGERIVPADVPWFTSVSSCGGTLVAPDRLLTAAHCVGGMAPADLRQVLVGGELRTVTGVALHPDFRNKNGSHNYLDDVAIVRLDRPVTHVVPVALGDSRELARIVGTGNVFAPGTGHSEAEMITGGGLRQAGLRQVSDADCAQVYARNHPGTGERFNAARMRCAVDVDGREPLSSGCFGDSGGPLVVGPNSAPVQVGVVSWGGDKCGADHSPSVFADVARYRSFILSPAPVWGPTQHLRVSVKDHRCSAAGREPGTKLTYVWKRRVGHVELEVVGTGRTYRGRAMCFVMASNAGGEIIAGISS